MRLFYIQKRSFRDIMAGHGYLPKFTPYSVLGLGLYICWTYGNWADSYSVHFLFSGRLCALYSALLFEEATSENRARPREPLKHESWAQCFSWFFVQCGSTSYHSSCSVLNFEENCPSCQGCLFRHYHPLLRSSSCDCLPPLARPFVR